MYIFLIFLQLLSLPAPSSILEIQKGEITYYGKTVMERVYDYRLEHNTITPCPECIGNIAVRDRKYMNQYAYLITKHGISGPYLIIDCSAAKNLSAHIKRKLIAEVSYTQSRKWRMTGPLKDSIILITERP